MNPQDPSDNQQPQTPPEPVIDPQVPPQQPYPTPPSNPQEGPQTPSELPPPVTQPQQQHQQMYYTRPLEPQAPVMSEDIKRKCEESRQKYPGLNLSEGEYVLSDVKRHPIGLLGVWLLTALVIVAIVGALAMLLAGSRDAGASDAVPPQALGLAAVLLSTLALIGGYIATYIYRANKFYLTNESVIQNIQTSLFSNHEQTVSLGNVEDASYIKSGIIQTIFDYGTIRLSTQGDETTYRFTYASNPDSQIALLNNAVEAFKNGRPIHDDDDPHHR